MQMSFESWEIIIFFCCHHDTFTECIKLLAGAPLFAVCLNGGLNKSCRNSKAKNTDGGGLVFIKENERLETRKKAFRKFKRIKIIIKYFAHVFASLFYIRWNKVAQLSSMLFFKRINEFIEFLYLFVLAAQTVESIS